MCVTRVILLVAYQEKEIKLVADDKTTYENVQSIGDIKEKSTVSVDYIALPEGKNVAKNISLEKAESAAVKGVDNDGVAGACVGDHLAQAKPPFFTFAAHLVLEHPVQRRRDAV